MKLSFPAESQQIGAALLLSRSPQPKLHEKSFRSELISRSREDFVPPGEKLSELLLLSELESQKNAILEERGVVQDPSDRLGARSTPSVTFDEYSRWADGAAAFVFRRRAVFFVVTV